MGHLTTPVSGNDKLMDVASGNDCYTSLLKPWPMFEVDLPSYKMVDLSIVMLVYQRVNKVYQPTCNWKGEQTLYKDRSGFQKSEGNTVASLAYGSEPW